MQIRWSNTTGQACKPLTCTERTRTRRTMSGPAWRTFPETATTNCRRSRRGRVCCGGNNAGRGGVDTTTAFKPFNDNTRDIGTSSLRVRDFYLGRNLVMSGTATTYNGKATAGTGLTQIYRSGSVTGQTAAIASTTLCAISTCGAGQYVLNYYVDATVACATAGSAAASLTIGWTDETRAKTLQGAL